MDTTEYNSAQLRVGKYTYVVKSKTKGWSPDVYDFVKANNIKECEDKMDKYRNFQKQYGNNPFMGPEILGILVKPIE